MENGMEKAIEQMKNKEESGLNYIYSKTYNFVYLRAKTIFEKEEDIQQLMQDVYLHAYESSNELKRETLYEWLGKSVYELGCRSFKKKKERETSYLEMEKEELNPKKIENQNQCMETICSVLDELPDMYEATLFAFYYDYMKIDDIAQMMECTSGIVKNRLNYVRKYMKKAMEHYMEEHAGVKIAFSVEALCHALREWSIEHCLGMTTAQRVYSNICKKADLSSGSIYLEGKEFAGVNNTIVYHKQDDWNMIQEEIIHHSKKYGWALKRNMYLAGIAGLLVVLAVGVAIWTKKPSEKEKEEQPQVNQTMDKQKDEQQKPEETTEPKTEEQPVKPQPQEQEPVAEPEPQEPISPVQSEYIFMNSQTEKLTEEEVWARTKEELRLARNEIFARHGVIFGVEDLDTYFRGKSWYTPAMSLSDFMDTMELSMVEESNISLIQQVESEME